MRWLIFLSRVAFISGIAMLIAFSLGFTSWNKTETFLHIIVLAGYGLAAILLPLINLLYLVLVVVNLKRLSAAPRWLIASNIIFFIIYLIFTFYINDPYYH